MIFYSCGALVQALLRAKREVSPPKLLKRLLRFDALIIDDIGYMQQSWKEMEVLFQLLAARYKRGSVLVTSNLAFSQWVRIFKDPMTTAAAIDHLVHHCVILELNVPSYRLEASKRRQEAASEAAGTASRDSPSHKDWLDYCRGVPRCGNSGVVGSTPGEPEYRHPYPWNDPLCPRKGRGFVLKVT